MRFISTLTTGFLLLSAVCAEPIRIRAPQVCSPTFSEAGTYTLTDGNGKIITTDGNPNSAALAFSIRGGGKLPPGAMFLVNPANNTLLALSKDSKSTSFQPVPTDVIRDQNQLWTFACDTCALTPPGITAVPGSGCFVKAFSNDKLCIQEASNRFTVSACDANNKAQKFTLQLPK